MSSVASLTIEQVQAGLAARKFSAVELAQSALQFAQAENSKTNAYPALLSGTRSGVRRTRGQEAGCRRRRGTAGRRSVGGERRDRHPGRPHHLRLAAAGTLHSALRRHGREFAWNRRALSFWAKQTATSSPWDPRTRTPRSGRCAIRWRSIACPAVPAAARLRQWRRERRSWRSAPTRAGPVRQPASFCGVVGVTPTYGRVSRYGLAAFASSLDHIGPFARTVRDAALLLETMAGRDDCDATSAFAPVPRLHGATGWRGGRHEDRPAARVFRRPRERIGRPHPACHSAARKAGLRGARHQPARDRNTPCPATTSSPPPRPVRIWRATTACATPLARTSDTLSGMYRATRGEGFGAECKRRIMLGTYVLSPGYYDAYYLKAQKVRALIAARFCAGAFTEVDAIVAPVSPFPAFKIGREDRRPAGNVFVRYLHYHRRSGRHSLHERSVRQDSGRAAGGNADPHPAFRRNRHVPPGGCF